MADSDRSWVGLHGDGGFEVDRGIAEHAGFENDTDGRIRTAIPEQKLVEHVEELLNPGDHLSTIAMALGLSRKVLARRLYDLGWTRVYHTITPHDCQDAILSIVPLNRAGCNWGIRHAQSLVQRELGLRIPQQQVRDVLHTLQPGHMRRREVRALFRGQYDIVEPTVLWHMDSYDKLVKWKFKIHGGIDGASHFVLWCMVATDKLATKIFKGYKAAVDLYGHPIRVRSDYAAEHSLVRREQERARPDVIKTSLTGSSVHNQRIEHFWGQVWKKTAWFYHSLFTMMCNENVLDLNNVWHMSSLHLVFLPLIQDDVDLHISAWNNHRLRKISENGRDIPSHVLEAAFQTYKRQQGWIKPPGVLPSDNERYGVYARLPAVPDQEEEPAVLDGEAQGLIGTPLDLTGATLPTAINDIRDQAYELGKGRYPSGEEKYAFHLGLTTECLEALRWTDVTMTEYFKGRMEEVDDCQLHFVQALYVVVSQGG